MTICEEHIHVKDPNCEDCAKEWAEQVARSLPPLAPAEHAWIEERVGRKMTNEEAQLALREAKLTGAFNVWAEGRKA